MYFSHDKIDSLNKNKKEKKKNKEGNKNYS